MKYTFVIPVFFLSMIGSVFCSKNIITAGDSNNGSEPMTTVRIKIGDKQFQAKLSEDISAVAFKTMLPLTMRMTELNGNEKYFQLPNSLPTNASNPRTINAGDLLLWGKDTFVLFYKTFSTSYSYTKIGKIEEPSGLAEALGSGDVTVTIELE
jgi:hypothetical protein